MGVGARSGKKGRKYGRNKIWGQRYREEGRKLKNKLLRMARHLKKHPKDTKAIHLLKEAKKPRLL